MRPASTPSSSSTSVPASVPPRMPPWHGAPAGHRPRGLPPPVGPRRPGLGRPRHGIRPGRSPRRPGGAGLGDRRRQPAPQRSPRHGATSSSAWTSAPVVSGTGCGRGEPSHRFPARTRSTPRPGAREEVERFLDAHTPGPTVSPSPGRGSAGSASGTRRRARSWRSARSEPSQGGTPTWRASRWRPLRGQGLGRRGDRAPHRVARSGTRVRARSGCSPTTTSPGGSTTGSGSRQGWSGRAAGSTA